MSFKKGGRSKEFATHKSELLKKTAQTSASIQKAESVSSTANQNKIITRTIFPMLSLFYDLEKTSIA